MVDYIVVCIAGIERTLHVQTVSQWSTILVPEKVVLPDQQSTSVVTLGSPDGAYRKIDQL